MPKQDPTLRAIENLLNQNTLSIMQTADRLARKTSLKAIKTEDLAAIAWECKVVVGPDGRPTLECKIGGDFRI